MRVVNGVSRLAAVAVACCLLTAWLGVAFAIAREPATGTVKVVDLGAGRLNISAIDLLPGRTRTWPLAKAPWSDGFAFVSPVDHYGARGRNGFGLADMCGGVWEVVLDHFDPKGAHEEPYFVRENPRPVCRGGNYFDVPGNARCAVRLGLMGPHYSDSRDGFRICLGPRIEVP